MQLVVVIGTPVDEFLGPSMTIFEKAVDQIAPHLRDGALVVAPQHRLPGHDRLRRPAPRRARLRGRRRVLPGADRRGPRARGAARRCRRSSAPTRTVAAERASRAVRHARLEDDPDDDQGSRAGQALHQHLALHEVRRRQPVLHDRRPGRRGLHERPAGDPRRLPARRGPAGPGLRRRPCLFKDTMQLAAFTADHFPLGQAAMQVNEGLPAYIVSALERRYGGLQGKTVGILGMAFKAESDDTARVAQLQAPQAPVVGRRAGPRTDPYVAGRPARRRSTASSRRATSWSSARRTRRTAASRSAARTSSTSGAPSARGSGSSARSSSPAPPGSSTATSSRSCSRPATRSSGSTTSASTAA